MKNKTLIIWAVVVGFILLMVGCGCSQYNGLVDKDENVKKAFGNIQAAYQNRSDLIPNLVNTVRGAANFEQETLTKVVEARAKATQVNFKADDLTPEKLEQFQKAQGELSSSLSRLLVTVESYPNLKATENFAKLQSSLEGIESSIRGERKGFNDEVAVFNKKVRSFPLTLFAGMFGFKKYEPFQADQEAQKAPKVPEKF